MKLIVVDTETGGLVSKVYSLLSVGMWTIDTVEKTLTNPLYFLVKEPRIVTTSYAMRINGLKVEDLERDGLTPEDALSTIRDYCSKVGSQPIPVGHNVGFDIGFLERLLDLTDSSLDLPFHYRTIDVPAVLYTMYLAGILPKDISSSQKALEYFGMERGSVHNALHDAECTGKVYLTLLSILSDANTVLDSTLGPLNPLRGTTVLDSVWK